MRRILLSLGMMACNERHTIIGGGADPDNADSSFGAGGAGGDDNGDGGDGVSDSGDALPAEGFAVGDRAPALLADDHAGALWSLREQPAGRPILLTFGHLYTDGPFDQNLDYLGEIAAAADLRVVAYLGFDSTLLQADVDDAAAALRAYGLSEVLVSREANLLTFNAWAENNPPKMYLLDGDQVIQWSAFGYVPEDSLRTVLGL